MSRKPWHSIVCSSGQGWHQAWLQIPSLYLGRAMYGGISTTIEAPRDRYQTGGSSRALECLGSLYSKTWTGARSGLSWHSAQV